ncbi:protein phosphatase 2C 33 [Populus alba x Populus x berolinensis]|nr:protein phosphatase 2C 33 [Populus alba x Populus x berolinensis]
MVAKRVRDSLPLKLTAHWEMNATSEAVLKEISLNTTGSMNSEDTSFISADEEPRASVDLEDAEKHPENFQTLKESFLKAFKVMDRELRWDNSSYFSQAGSISCPRKCWDSRAVLGTRDKDDYLVAVQLTVDLKPNLPAEAERIRKCKGRVFALQDEPEVARVWLPNNDSPGLAMARAFGDFCLKDFGLISIWDVLSNKEVVDIVASVSSRSSAARALVESAVRAWRYKYPTSKIDDCAVVCLFLKTNDLSTASNIKANEQLASVDQADNGRQKEDDLPSLTCLDRAGGNAEEDSTKQDEMQLECGIEWSALEGVSRVNTMLNLPRFVPGKEGKKAAGEAKTRK